MEGEIIMSFGMPTLIEIDSLEETAKLCRNLGLDFIELNMNLPQYQIEELEDTRYLKEIKEKYKIDFTIHLDENLNVCDFNKSVAYAYTDTVIRAIRVAKKMDIPILNMHMNHGVHFTLPDKKVLLFEKYNMEYMKAWESFREKCEKEIGDCNIKICIENTNGFRDYEKRAIGYLLESNVFALTMDIGHSNAIKNIDEEFIMEHKDRLKHFHIHDGLEKQDHMTLGSGEIDLKQRLDIAKSCSCRCVIETKTVESLKQSVNWLYVNKII